MKKQKSLLGAMSLKERYEKRLWALILEDSGAPTGSTEPTPEQIEESIQKLAEKIKNAGIESLKEPINSLNQQFQKLKSIDSSKDEDEVKKLTSDMKNYFETLLTDPEGEFNEEQKNAMISSMDYIDYISDLGKKFFSSSTAEEKKSIETELKIQIQDFVSKSQTTLDNLDSEAAEKFLDENLPNYISFWRKFFKEQDELPSMEEMLSVVNTLDKKITAIIKAYGAWLQENKEAIGEILEALKETAGTQTAGYRRLGNTLFERFLMSGGLR